MTAVTTCVTTKEPSVLRWTVDRYHRLVDTGILTEDDRTELIDGSIVVMSPPGTRHANRVRLLNHILSLRIGDRGLVDVQNPVELDLANEPQPDLVVLKPTADGYLAHHPRAEDILVVIEVVYSSAHHDRTVKLPIYARSGVAEVWLIDVEAGRVEAYTTPGRAGYEHRQLLDRAGTLAIAALPDLVFTGLELLGPAP